MRILVTGSTGLLGHTLLPVLRQNHRVMGLSSKDCDIRDETAVRRVLHGYRPELLIHLAAYTDVDGCELDPRRADELNGTGTRNFARACAEVDAAILYLSTDYVFDGRKTRPYSEFDGPNPINSYGRSKLLGEQFLQGTLDRYFVVRTSWLFGPHGKNFVQRILQAASQQASLRVVNDQCGSPTYTRHLAMKLSELIKTNGYGIYHITGSGSCTWFELASSILRLSGLTGVRLAPISSAECGRSALRPANSVLENRRLRLMKLGLLPNWREGLIAFLNELMEDSKLLGESAYESREGRDVLNPDPA